MNLRSDNKNIIPVIKRPTALIHQVCVKCGKVYIADLITGSGGGITNLSIRTINVRCAGKDVED
jgi:hypothetical protein